MINILCDIGIHRADPKNKALDGRVFDIKMGLTARDAWCDGGRQEHMLQ